MFRKTKPSERIIQIINFLNARRLKPPTLSEIVDHLNNHPDVHHEVSLRTVQRALQAIKENEINVKCRIVDGEYIYELDESNELPLIEEEDKADLGILLQLINTHEDLKSVSWLKSRLMEDYGMREEHFQKDDYFVLPKPIMRNHDKILRLAMEIVRFAKSGKVIQFWYQSINESDDTKLITVAPMQVRFYDGRYYLVGCTLNNKMEPRSRQTMFSLDKINEQEISVAINETDDMIDDHVEDLTFNRKTLSKQIGLNDYFNNCVGIMRPESEKPKYILLKFSGWAIAHVLNNPIHHSQKVVESKENLTISIDVYDTNELQFVLNKYSTYCQRLN